jgi:hypothetical protein
LQIYRFAWVNESHPAISIRVDGLWVVSGVVCMSRFRHLQEDQALAELFLNHTLTANGDQREDSGSLHVFITSRIFLSLRSKAVVFTITAKQDSRFSCVVFYSPLFCLLSHLSASRIPIHSSLLDISTPKPNSGVVTKKKKTNSVSKQATAQFTAITKIQLRNHSHPLPDGIS